MIFIHLIWGFSICSNVIEFIRHRLIKLRISKTYLKGRDDCFPALKRDLLWVHYLRLKGTVFSIFEKYIIGYTVEGIVSNQRYLLVYSSKVFNFLRYLHVMNLIIIWTKSSKTKTISDILILRFCPETLILTEIEQ